MTLQLFPTSVQWLECVLENFDDFLLDHASAEKKASSMALTFISHYPDKQDLVTAMTELAIEELAHFKEVVKIIHQRGLQLNGDSKDSYVNEFLKTIKKGTEHYLSDRLLVAGIIEARGNERFALIANGLPSGDLKSFYQAIAESESKHSEQFITFAEHYDTSNDIENRLSYFLDKETEIIKALPIKPGLH